MKGLGSTLAFGLLALTLLTAADRAAAEPSEEQVAAIKANCRSDFMSKCRGVPRGGKEAMQCLKDNVASVSPGCQQALKPLMAAAPAKAPAPAPAVAKPESAPASAPETTAKTAPAAPTTPESKPATTAATLPTAPVSEPAPAAQPKAAAKTPDKPAAPAAPPAKEQAAVEKPAAAPAAPAASEETPIIGFIPPRKKLMILRNCRQDLDTYCPDVSYGEGRQLSCLVSNRASLSADCQGALAKLTR